MSTKKTDDATAPETKSRKVRPGYVKGAWISCTPKGDGMILDYNEETGVVTFQNTTGIHEWEVE